MTDVAAGCIRKQQRFLGIEKFDKKVALTSSMVYADGLENINEVLASGWAAAEEAVHGLETETAGYIGVRHAVALNSGTAAVHLALKLAAERLYGRSTGISTLDSGGKGGALLGRRVFCPDFASVSLTNPVLYEGGEPVFIDASPEDWCMDPEVLEIAFSRYPDVRIVIISHIYGFPGQIKRVKEICRGHGALLIEDASESLGAAVDGQKAGSFGDYSVLSFGCSRMITGGCGGMLLTDDVYSAKKAAYWASLAKARAPWNQHEELGYHYAMDGMTAAMIRSQFRYLSGYIARKKEIYDRYLEKLNRDVICMNPIGEGTEPDYWTPCMLSESNIAFQETRSGRDYTYTNQHGTAAPMEIYDALEAFGAESCPAYKPMHIARGLSGRTDDLHEIGRYRRYTGLDSDLVMPNQMIKYLKFGFGFATDEVGYDIREGRLSREDAIWYVKEYDGKCGEKYIDLACRYLSITREEFWEVVDRYVNKDLFEKNDRGEWIPRFKIGCDYDSEENSK